MDAFKHLLDAPQLLATMIVILVIGILVDTVFGRADITIRRRWGLGGRGRLL